MIRHRKTAAYLVVDRRRPGFTLVELLVVVAIIGLLISVLLPSLHKARQMAKQTVCATRCHQLGIGLNTYLVDYGNYPAHQVRMDEFNPTLPGDFRVRWFDALAIVLAGHDMARTPEQSIEDWEAFKRKNTIFDLQGCPCAGDWEVGRNNSYGYNYKYVGSYRDNSAADNPFAPKECYPVKQVRSPGRTIGFADCDGTGWIKEWAPEKPRPGGDHDPDRLGNHGYILDPTYIPVWSTETYSGGALESYAWTDWRTYLSDRHLGYSVAAFLDGHAERINPKAAYQDNALWNGLGLDPGIQPDGTQDQTHPMYKQDPHVDYKWCQSSGQQWREYK